MSKTIRFIYLIVLLVGVSLAYVSYHLIKSKARADEGQRLAAIAQEAAKIIIGEDHEGIEAVGKDDIELFYSGIQGNLKTVQKEAREKYGLDALLYTLRPTKNNTGAVYIITTGEVQRIGADAPFPAEAQDALQHNTATYTDLYSGERGEPWLSAFAPIVTADKSRVVGLVRADGQASVLATKEQKFFLLWAIGSLGGGALGYVLLAALLEVRRRGFKLALSEAFLGRLGVRLSIYFAVLIAAGVSITALLSYQNARLSIEKAVGEKLRAIVYSGALGLDGDDYRTAVDKTITDEKSLEADNVKLFLFRLQERAGSSTDIFTLTNTQEGPTAFSAGKNSDDLQVYPYQIPISRELSQTFTEGGASYTKPYQRAGDENTLNLVSAYAPILNENNQVVGVLAADQNISNLQSEFFNQFLQNILYGLVGAILAVAVALFFTQRAISEPLQQLTNACQEIGHGNFKVTIEAPHNELGVLAKTLQHMIVELDARDRQLAKEIQARSNYERFFPPQIIDTAAKDLELFRPGGGRELKVTVLFADIRNYTKLSRDMKPSDVAAMLNEYFTVVVAEVFKSKGTLEKYIGDALMAIWGAPVPAKDQATKAAEAAINMLFAIRKLNQRWIAEGKAWRLDVGIGLNTGLCFVGNIGTADYLQYAAIGSTTNLSARLCSLAGPSEIVLSQESHDDIEEHPLQLPHRFVQMDPSSLKGFDALITPYRLDWKKPDPSGQ
jgi:class 3 adenylate cyclase